MRVGFLGPAGTYSEEAVLAGGGADLEPVPLPTVHDAVAAVREGRVERALVPIENSLEGSVNATLDALAQGDGGVQITGELVHPIHHCLIARAPVAARAHRRGRLASAGERPVRRLHPHAAARRRGGPGGLDGGGGAPRRGARSGGEAPWAAIGSRTAAALYGCEVLEADVEDAPGSETRFVWIARETPDPATGSAWKTALLFWEPDDDRPGWLVRCLAEFADRDVNLTRIESRPRREGLGSYMFFVDLDGHASAPAVAEAIEALRTHAAAVRVLGSFPTAP